MTNRGRRAWWLRSDFPVGSGLRPKSRLRQYASRGLGHRRSVLPSAKPGQPLFEDVDWLEEVSKLLYSLKNAECLEPQMFRVPVVECLLNFEPADRGGDGRVALGSQGID